MTPASSKEWAAADAGALLDGRQTVLLRRAVSTKTVRLTAPIRPVSDGAHGHARRVQASTRICWGGGRRQHRCSTGGARGRRWLLRSRPERVVISPICIWTNESVTPSGWTSGPASPDRAGGAGPPLDRAGRAAMARWLRRLQELGRPPDRSRSCCTPFMIRPTRRGRRSGPTVSGLTGSRHGRINATSRRGGWCG